MKASKFDRRKFIKSATAVTSAAGIFSILPKGLLGGVNKQTNENVIGKKFTEPRIFFSVIGINHNHIYSQVDATIRGGGQLVSFHAKEDDLAAAFAKKYPQAKRVNDDKEILEDKSVQLVLSSIIPNQRAPLGIRVMQHGKDYMSDKPGITSLEQLAEARRVQKQTGRIYSIMYSERFENKATVKAGELVKAGVIGKVIQTIGLGPHRMSTATRPQWFFDKKKLWRHHYRYRFTSVRPVLILYRLYKSSYCFITGWQCSTCSIPAV